eukprot:2257531-Pyramimonas_sp.AAC.2
MPDRLYASHRPRAADIVSTRGRELCTVCLRSCAGMLVCAKVRMSRTDLSECVGSLSQDSSYQELAQQPGGDASAVNVTKSESFAQPAADGRVEVREEP